MLRFDFDSLELMPLPSDEDDVVGDDDEDEDDDDLTDDELESIVNSLPSPMGCDEQRRLDVVTPMLCDGLQVDESINAMLFSGAAGDCDDDRDPKESDGDGCSRSRTELVLSSFSIMTEFSSQ